MPNSDQIRGLRKIYGIDYLEQKKMDSNPNEQFKLWFKKALDCPEIGEANIMVLATSGNDMQPSSRIVLLKGIESEGLVFFTNYNSEKSQQIKENPKASLLFFWDAFERQVRIEGTIEKLNSKDSDEYFNSRPKGSRLGAIASDQSAEIQSRQILEDKLKDLEDKYSDTDQVPRPDHWGGFILKPNYWEFWQGRPNRLHDRIAYKLTEEGKWKMSRLSP